MTLTRHVGPLARAAVLSLLACSAPAQSGGLDPAELTSIEVTPTSVTMAPNASQVFAAQGFWSDGSHGTVPVTWTVSGGSMAANGTYTASGTPGTYVVRAVFQGGGYGDSAVVTVDAGSPPPPPPPPPQLVSLDVTPASVTLDPGETRNFVVQGQWSDAVSRPVTVMWSSTGGTVSTSGSYIAGPTAGSFVVRAIAPGTTIGDSAAVVIQDTTSAPPPPPPPPPPPTTLVQEGFEDTGFTGRGWYDNTSLTITGAEHRPGGTKSLEATFNQGSSTPTFGNSMRIRFTPTESVYLSYWVKYSANWVGSAVSYHPHEFQFITDEDGQYIGPSATHLTTYVEHNYQNGGIPLLAMQDALNIDAGNVHQDLSQITENRAAGGCNGDTDGYATDCYQAGTQWRNDKHWKAAQPTFKPAPGPGYKNDWHHVEAYFQLNTIQGGKGQTNGIAQYWFDGQLVIDHHDVLFRTGIHSTMKFNQFLIAPYIGVGSPVTQTMWVDDLVIQSAHP